ncbi:MAG: hypothetical protein J5723_07935 [Ruminococcus sp.]|nr:hypothetical protein [Ruminococcus sp.]
MKITSIITPEESERNGIRLQIENIIKVCGIDRTRFYEYSKIGYSDVITRFLYTFTDFKKDVKNDSICLDYCFLRFRKEWKKLDISFDWADIICKTREYISEKTDGKVFLILSQGWVYEGFIDEIMTILGETDYHLNDFYIVSPKYEWLAAYCDDGDAMVIFEKGR